MIKFSTILFYLLICFYVKGQKFDSTIISLPDIQSFFNSIRGSSYLASNALIISTPYQINYNILINKKDVTDSIFSIDDLNFIKIQIDKSKKLKWNNNFIDSASFISKNSLDSFFKANRRDENLGWINFRKIKKRTSYFEMSLPYFSKDKRCCLIYLSYLCGMVCGEGGLYIFKFDEGKWILFKTLSYWES